MADIYRYRYGETNPLNVAVRTTTFPNAGTAVAVSIGDLCYIDTADGFTIKPASSLAWGGTLAATQATFVTNFIGVAMQRWDGVNLATGNKDGTIELGTEGIYLFATATATYNVGDLVGLDAASNQLLPQQVIAVGATKANAIGRVERLVTSGTSVYVRIFGSKMTGIQS